MPESLLIIHISIFTLFVSFPTYHRHSIVTLRWVGNSFALHMMNFNGDVCCKDYHRRKWRQRHEFKFLDEAVAFRIALTLLGKVWIQLFLLDINLKTSMISIDTAAETGHWLNKNNRKHLLAKVNRTQAFSADVLHKLRGFHTRKKCADLHYVGSRTERIW